MSSVAHGATAAEANDRIGIPAEPHALADEERAAAIALAAMPDSDSRSLSAAPTRSTDASRSAKNPLADDLEGTNPTTISSRS